MPPRRRRRSPDPDRNIDELVDLRAKKAATWPKKEQMQDDIVETFGKKRCIAWFQEYSGVDDDLISPDGMEKFCEDIGVEPENIVMLVLAWKLAAKSMGFFTMQEWLKGMTELQEEPQHPGESVLDLIQQSSLFEGIHDKHVVRLTARELLSVLHDHNSPCQQQLCDTTSKVRKKLDFIRSYLNDPVCFKSIYRYAYDFAKDKDQRSMDIETAKAMLSLLLGKHWPLHSLFHQFLEQSKYKVINKDQWCNILEFSRTIHTDLSNYDEDGAWPVMLDEFVEWLKEQNTFRS